MEIIIFRQCIMEKGDKPKADVKASKTQSGLMKVKKPRAKKAQKQTQKQEQKQSVKIVIGEKKPKRKYVRKPKAKVLPAVRGTTSVSTIIQQDTDGLAQVITPIKPAPQVQAPAPKPPAPKPPAPKQPLLSAEQAPTTLDTELTAVSELVYPKARSPAFQEVQEKPPKRATKAKVKKTFSESIGDFIKTNLLDQPADLHIQEADREVEMPRPPLTIVPESPPVKPKPKRKGKTDVPISIQADPKIEQIQMGMEDVNIAVKPKQKRKGKTDVPISIVTSKEVERKEMSMEDIDVAPVKQKLKKESLDLQGEYDRFEKLIGELQEKEYLILKPTYTKSMSFEERRGIEKEAEKIAEEADTFRMKQFLIAKEMGLPYDAKRLAVMQYNRGLISKDDFNREIRKQTETEATEIVSLQDTDPASKEELNESLRKMIVVDTIDDIIGTIETPVFSENPDFKTISQNVEIDSAPSSMLDYGDEGLTELGVEGFIPVGNVRGMIEEIERKTGGRPRKYDTEEEAKEAKRLQTIESNRKARAEKKLGSFMERYIKQEKLNEEYGEFVSQQESLDNLTDLLTRGREATRREQEQISSTNPFKLKSIYIAEEIPVESDFLKNEVGALTRLDNYGKVQIMSNDETDYQENPVIKSALFSTDAVDSNFPVADVEFL